MRGKIGQLKIETMNLIKKISSVYMARFEIWIDRERGKGRKEGDTNT